MINQKLKKMINQKAKEKWKNIEDHRQLTLAKRHSVEASH
jgi:hypothetical protein